MRSSTRISISLAISLSIYFPGTNPLRLKSSSIWSCANITTEIELYVNQGNGFGFQFHDVIEDNLIVVGSVRSHFIHLFYSNRQVLFVKAKIYCSNENNLTFDLVARPYHSIPMRFTGFPHLCLALAKSNFCLCVQFEAGQKPNFTIALNFA